MTQFDPNRTYSAERDVRPSPLLLSRLRDSKPEGCLWVLVGTRRSGKSWALRGLHGELLRGGIEAKNAKVVELNSNPNGFFSGTPTYLLVDEPGNLLNRDPGRMLERCAALKQRGSKVVAAMTPHEWLQLRAAATGGQLNIRDRLVVKPLDGEQAARMAERATWAADLLSRIERSWSRNPFILELLLSEAERLPDLRRHERILDLYEQVMLRALDTQTEYFHYVFDEGLGDDHRRVLRALSRGDGIQSSEALDLLRDSGVIDTVRPGEFKVSDPILARLLPPPIVIHHVSDVHFGRKAAAVVDNKADKGLGKPFAEAISPAVRRPTVPSNGPATAADSYRAHVEESTRHARGPHLLIVSGDLAETAAESEFMAARAWLDALDNACRMQLHPDLGEEPRVLLTGGNHDVEWGKARATDPVYERHQAFAVAFEGYEHPHLERPAEGRPLALVSYLRADFDVVLLGSSEFGGQDDPRMRELTEQLWERSAEAFRTDNLAVYENLRGELERIDPSLVHESALQALRSRPCTSAVRIAVLHHPLSALPGVLTVARFSGLLNTGAVKGALMTAGVQLVLHGHEHSAFLTVERWPGYLDCELHIASAPSLGSREVAEHRGYNEIRISREGLGRVDVSIQAYVQIGNAWKAQGEPVMFRVNK